MHTLNEKLKALRGQEKKLLLEILLTISEVEKTKLFLQLAYPSLFEYLVKEIGYCPASAQRRIDSVRLMQQVPDLGTKIAAGSVSLSQVSKVQQAVRLAKKSGTLVSRETKQSIINRIENKSPRQTEQILAQEFSLEILQAEKLVAQRDQSLRVELTFSSEEMIILEEAKALLSNSSQAVSMHDLMMDLATRFVKSRTKLKSAADSAATRPQQNITIVPSQNVNTVPHQNVNTVAKQNMNSAPLRMSTRKIVLQSQQSCQHTDPVTGRRCNSKYFLHYDHIQERQFGGSNEAQNLRLLCGNHHRMRHAGG